MSRNNQPSLVATGSSPRRGAIVCLAVALTVAWWATSELGSHALAQSSAPPGAGELEPAEPRVAADEIQAVMNAGLEDAEQAPTDAPSGIDMLSLILSGGRFMIPIALMSLVVVTLVVERTLSLRRGKVIPRQLVRKLEELATPIDSFDPPKAYQACVDHPSPTAVVVGAMLMRTGQPLGEIERAANEAIQRESERYASPVRWLGLAAAATPLMGLLGTVWGMIVAFHESTTLTADRSRSEQLSEGIYTALVTTLAGLAVAIPAAIFAQYLENRISKLFHHIEQLTFDLAPGLARFVGRRRLNGDGQLVSAHGVNEPPVAAPPPPPHTGEASRGVGKTARAS